ncbi:DUF2521 domain-containing protein [Bacillus sp. V3-13]|uniref:YbaK family protein n=1 Tax=Bacillus sp. V3-13 TaxID=2053728 RepID=UPI000C76904F|nr:YbaK family protein [Bacillus sp. V3-13]PLR77850.1 DUF2521 domain-containing protein [Bacillus sp. V3-13]
MNVITSFKEKKRAKQIKYERSVLRDISVNLLKKKVQHYFGSSRFITGLLMNAGLEEALYDVAIEAYLLGANFSKFGYYGEAIEETRKRCTEEEKHLTDTLYHFLLFWGKGEEGVYNETLLTMCEQYVETWWREGYLKGERRYKLRLH